MSSIFPIAHLEGLTPLAFILISVVLGVAFGFFLERAGFGSAKVLSSIFILRDFRVFRVMFAAVVTAMLGSQILRAAGLLNLSLVSYSPNYFWSMLVGGLVFGVGFYVGGYCPGTAIVGAVRGRLDAPFFLLGITLGIYAFALLYDAVGTEAWFTSFFAPADATRQTLYGDGPAWPWILGITAIALVAFRFVPIVEKRFALRTVEQLEAARSGRPVPENTPPKISGSLLKIGAPLAGGTALLIVGLDLARVGTPPGTSDPRPAAIAVDDESLATVDPLTVASWAIAEAHRRAAEEPAGSYVVDLRPGDAGGRPVPGSIQVDLGSAEGDEAVAMLMDHLTVEAPLTASGRPVVLVGESTEGLGELSRGLRRRGVVALLLEGGYPEWERRVLDPEADWPMHTLRVASVEPPAGQEPEEATEEGETEPPEPTEEAPAEPAEPAEPSHAEGEHHGGASEAPAPELPQVDLAALHQELRDWLAGRAEGLPPRLSMPGTIPPQTKAVTVQATGGAGGGCG